MKIDGNILYATMLQEEGEISGVVKIAEKIASEHPEYAYAQAALVRSTRETLPKRKSSCADTVHPSGCIRANTGPGCARNLRSTSRCATTSGPTTPKMQLTG